MQTTVERVMQAYRLMFNLTTEQEDDARERLERFLQHRAGSAEELAVQGLRFLRGAQAVRPRTALATTLVEIG